MSDDGKMCDTPGCSLAQRHAGGHSFLLVLSGKRERQHTAKSEQHRSANVTGATSTSSAAVQALGLLGSYLEGCGGAASMVEGWSVAFGPPRAHGSRQDLTFFSPCGKSCRSKMEVARFLGLEVMVAAKQNRTVASSSSADAVQALGLLGAHLESCGGEASMVEEWSVRVGPPRGHGSRQDLTFFSPCGKSFRSKVEVARFLGLEVMVAAKQRQHSTVASSSSAEAVQALGLLISHLESCGGAASMVEGWNVGVGPPRANGSRQDLTFFSPCGKSFRSKMEVARFLGLEVMVAARQNRTFASPNSAEAVQALGLLSSHLETCGGTASMVEGWSVGVGPPRAHGSRQDLTFSSPCGKTFRSKAEVARFLGLEVVPARKSRTFASSPSSAEAVQALGLLSSHLESCGGEASMVEGWNVGVGPPRPVIGQGRSRARQDLTFFSPCGKAFRSKAEVARYLGLESGAPLQASSKRARRLKQPADHLRSQALWVDAVVVVEADDAGGDVDATVVDAALW